MPHTVSKSARKRRRINRRRSRNTNEATDIESGSGEGVETLIPFRLLDFPQDLFDRLLDVCGIEAALQFGRINIRIRLHVKNYLLRRYHRILSPYFADVIKFRDILRETSAVVSGSSALRFIHYDNPGWDGSSSDLDIYVGSLWAKEIVAYLREQEGYKPITTVVHARQVATYTKGYKEHARHIHKVVKLTNGKTSVDVIIAKSTVSVLPVFAFHSTVVMNWLSADGIFCAYPTLTFNRLNIVNPSILVGHRRDLMRGRDFECLLKYLARGYNCHSLPEHVCRSSLSCPHTVRTTLDGNGFYYTLDDRTAEGHHVAQVGRTGVMWRLGGYACPGDWRNRSSAPMLLALTKVGQGFLQ